MGHGAPEQPGHRMSDELRIVRIGIAVAVLPVAEDDQGRAGIENGAQLGAVEQMDGRVRSHLPARGDTKIYPPPRSVLLP